MGADWNRVTRAALLVLIPLVGSSAASAQSSPWIDPPPDLGVPPPPPAGQEPQASASPAPEPEPAAPLPPAQATDAGKPNNPDPPEEQAPATPSTRSSRHAAPTPPPSNAERPPDRRDNGISARLVAAQELALDYLEFWSAPNRVALATTPDFYAQRVVFHGRTMTDRALLEEKRRFVRRWPERWYRHRPETMQVACDARGSSCTVRSLFDFVATSPDRGRRSAGVAALELVMDFQEGRPVIVSENSAVRSRGRSRSSTALGIAPED